MTRREALKVTLGICGSVLLLFAIVSGIVVGMIAWLGEDLGGPVALGTCFVLMAIGLYFATLKWMR